MNTEPDENSHPKPHFLVTPAGLSFIALTASSFALAHFGLYVIGDAPRPPLLLPYLAGIMGGATPIAILPLIWWGFRGFRPRKAHGPFVLWTIILIISAFLFFNLYSYETKARQPIIEKGSVGTLNSFLPLHALHGGIQMPFPEFPQSLGVLEEDGMPYAAYRHLTATSALGFSATVSLHLIPETRTTEPEAALRDHLFKVLIALDGRLQKNINTMVDGRPAQYIVATLGIFDHKVRSHTLAIYDEGVIYSWAVQDAPELSGDLGPRVFSENYPRIKIGTDARERVSSIQPSVYQLGDVLFLFLTPPVAETMPSQPGTAEMLYDQDAGQGLVWIAMLLRGKPTVDDATATSLRGGPGGRMPIEEGEVLSGDIIGRYPILADLSNASFPTHAAVSMARDLVYSWSLMGEEYDNSETLRKRFF